MENHLRETSVYASPADAAPLHLSAFLYTAETNAALARIPILVILRKGGWWRRRGARERREKERPEERKEEEEVSMEQEEEKRRTKRRRRSGWRTLWQERLKAFVGNYSTEN